MVCTTKVVFDINSYRYGFNAKENDTETGWQDYGMRMYNPKLARFFTVDPITHEYPELTPFQFASNRPIDGVDQDGPTIAAHGLEVVKGYDGDITNAFKAQSGTRAKLDFKYKAYELLKIDQNNLLEINGVVYNANEAGNYLWGSDVTENATKDAPSNGNGKYKWIYKESLGVGKLDYQSSGVLPGGVFSGGAYELYYAGGRVYNKADAGNFLWGRSMKLLKVNYLIVKAASEFNGFYNGRVQNNGVSRNGGTVKQNGFSFKRITWQGDTRADQRAIRRGYRGIFNPNSTNENSNENLIPTF